MIVLLSYGGHEQIDWGTPAPLPMKPIGPLVFNPRSGKVHRSVCHFARRTAYPVEPLAIEATTTDEALEQIAKRGLEPCLYCLPSARFGERKGRYVVRDGGSEPEEGPDERWRIVDTETNEVVEAFEGRRYAEQAAWDWSRAVELDPKMTPRRYEAERSLRQASGGRRSMETRWRDAIREMHEAGFSVREIAADAGVDQSHIAALLDDEQDNPGSAGQVPNSL